MEHLYAYALEQAQTPRCITATVQKICPRDLTVFDHILYFSGLHQSGGRRLWATDGMRTGLVVDMHDGETKYSPTNLIAFPERHYFTAFDIEHGEELFNINTQ